MPMIDHRIRQVKLLTTRNQSLEESIRALTVERDGLAAQLAEARQDAADARRTARYAEGLATSARDRIDALTGKQDARKDAAAAADLAAFRDLEAVRADTHAYISNGRRLRKGK